MAARTTVRNLSREAEVRETIAKLIPPAGKLEVVAADLTADAGWDKACVACDYVLHVASPLPAVTPKNDEELVRPARDGALRVLRAAREAGVKRVVMTASTAAISCGRGGRETPFTEEDWSDATNRADTSAYERSKTIAERAAWDWMAAEGGKLELTTINPVAVIGSVLGRDFSASIEIVKKLLEGSVPGLPRFGWPLVDVRDIADLHYRAMLSPKAAGQRFIGGQEFMWMADVAKVLRKERPGLSRRVPTRGFPNWLVRLAAAFDPVIRDQLFNLGKYRPVTAAKAERLLGWVPRPAAQAIAATADSLAAEGLVPAGR